MLPYLIVSVGFSVEIAVLLAVVLAFALHVSISFVLVFSPLLF